MSDIPTNTPLWRIMDDEGRTQVWLARRVTAILKREETPVDPRQVWGWVNGFHVPEQGTREAIAYALRRQVDSIAFGVRRPEREASAAA